MEIIAKNNFQNVKNSLQFLFDFEFSNLLNFSYGIHNFTNLRFNTKIAINQVNDFENF